MQWITRERARVDRIACPWLISRFIDREPRFLFVPPADVMGGAERERAIHMIGRGEGEMGMRRWTYGMLAVSVLLGLAAGVIWPARRAAAAPDWKVVEQALGKAGTLMPGGVYRVGLPRTDLTVT